MKIKRTDTFKKDIKKLDSQSKKILGKVIKKILASPERFKPMKYHSNIFRIRFSKFRLVYKVDQDLITFMFVRKRPTAYRNV
ncbi:MAG: type II toxin-antitoxin system RelE/ParE family toxin [Candidatus Diapherotrites archaeon]|nr:type II toxin-antitoxin system RelE/ParE family toxin [Candidatus Diapherotrites archaeon]